MNIVVCCKAVPGLVTDLKIAADGKAIQYQGQLLAINECDEYALEEALALKRTHGGQVTAISMGNIKALDILYYALAKGADKAVRVDFESQDPRVASTVIAAALAKLDYDLVLTGTQSRDTLGGQVGIAAASVLGIPFAYAVVGVEARENHTVKVRKELGGGRYAEVELTLPALLCVQTGIQPLTFVPPARRIRARQQPVASFSVADLGLQAEQLVTQGYRFVGVRPPERTHQVELLQGQPRRNSRCIAHQHSGESLTMARDILVLVEHADGKIESMTFQLLAIGQRLAAEMKVELVAAAIGHRLENVVEALRDSGIDRILVVDDSALASAAGEVQAQVFAEVARQIDPRLVLIGYSLVGMELTPAIANNLGMNALTNCVNIEIDDAVVTVTRPLFDGTMHAQIALEEHATAVVALQKGSTTATAPTAKQAVVQSITIDVNSLPSRSRVLEITEEPKSDVDLGKAEIIVAVGRGIGDKEKIHFTAELADALGGTLACSRPVVDVGWLPRERQVGASGKSVAPKVYVACGISGAIQHLTGMRDSKRIIAINKDPNAPIFQVAHIGVVGDLFEIVPALTRAAQEARTR